MKIFKFIVGNTNTPVPSYPGLEVKGIVAAVVAEDEAQARQLIKEDDWDSRWLEVAIVKVYEIDKPRILAYAGSI